MKRRRFLQSLAAIGAGIAVAKHIKPEDENIIRQELDHDGGFESDTTWERKIVSHGFVHGGVYVDNKGKQYFAIDGANLIDMDDYCVVHPLPDHLCHLSSCYIEQV